LRIRGGRRACSVTEEKQRHCRRRYRRGIAIALQKSSSALVKSDRDRQRNSVTDQADIAAIAEVEVLCLTRKVKPAILVQVGRDAEGRFAVYGDLRHVRTRARPPFNRVKSGSLQANFEFARNVLSIEIFPRPAKLGDRKSYEYSQNNQYY
jgi:hypothetical protein